MKFHIPNKERTPNYQQLKTALCSYFYGGEPMTILDQIYAHSSPDRINLKCASFLEIAKFLARDVKKEDVLPWLKTLERQKPAQTRMIVKSLLAISNIVDHRAEALAYCVLALDSKDWIEEFVPNCVMDTVGVKLTCMRILARIGDFNTHMLQVGGLLLNRASKDDIRAARLTGYKTGKSLYRIQIMELILDNDWARAGAKVVAALEQYS